jgi:ribonuclease VapC
MRFVVDTSALMAIRNGEPEREAFHRLLLEGQPLLSIATLAELTMVWQGRFGPDALTDLDRLLALYEVELLPVSDADMPWLRFAILEFGRGRAEPPAVLNYGDAFSYALAKRLGLPLLFKGDDFAATDVARMR